MRTFLHKLMVDITRHPRQIVVPGVDFVWSNKSWTHNVFRAYEYFFGRRYGPNGVGDTVRWEGSTFLIDGQVYHASGTWENTVAHAETMLRELLGNWELAFRIERVPQLQLVCVGGVCPIDLPPLNFFPYRFAIAYDSSNGLQQDSLPTITYSETCTGSNLILIAGVSTSSGTISAWTYGAGSLTTFAQSKAGTTPTSGYYLDYGGYLIAPTTGSNTYTVTSSTVSWHSCSSSYSGAKQSGFPDASNGSEQTGSTSYNLTLTVVAANSWMWAYISAGNCTLGASTGMTQRQSPRCDVLLGDSNGALAAGSRTLTYSQSSTANANSNVFASIPPVAAVSVNSGFFFAAAS